MNYSSVYDFIEGRFYSFNAATEEQYVKEREKLNKTININRERFYESLIGVDKTDDVDIIVKRVKAQYNTLSLYTDAKPFDFDNLRLIIERPVRPKEPKLMEITDRPKRIEKQYNKKLKYHQKFFINSIIRHFKKLQKSYLKDNDDWLEYIETAKRNNEKVKNKYKQEINKYKKDIQSIETIIKDREQLITSLRQGAYGTDDELIGKVIELNLCKIKFPLENFEHEIKCVANGETIRITAKLPRVENLITICGSRYVKRRKSTDIVVFKQSELNKMYHDLIKNYIASISQILGFYKLELSFDEYIINGKTRSKNNKKEVTTISTKTNKLGLFDGDDINEWYDSHEFYVGKKLSNYTDLKEKY